MIALALLVLIVGLSLLVHAPPLIVWRLVRWAVLRTRHIRAHQSERRPSHPEGPDKLSAMSVSHAALIPRAEGGRSGAEVAASPVGGTTSATSATQPPQAKSATYKPTSALPQDFRTTSAS